MKGSLGYPSPALTYTFKGKKKREGEGEEIDLRARRARLAHDTSLWPSESSFSAWHTDPGFIHVCEEMIDCGEGGHSAPCHRLF